MAEAKILADLLPLVEPIDSLIPLPGNPRRGKVEAIAASLDEFGMHGVIVVQRGTNFICKGNHTWRAAKKLGWDKIPVVWTDDDVATARARALADNKTSEGGTNDRAEEAAMMAEVAATDASLLLSAGYAQDEIDALLAAAASATPPIEADPPAAKPERRPPPEDDGVQIRQVEARERSVERPVEKPAATFDGAPGEASLFIGHCLDVLAEMPDDCMGCVITDPIGGMSQERSPADTSGPGWEHSVPGPTFWTEIARVMKPGAHIAVMGSPQNSHRLAVAMEDGGLVIKDTICWLYAHGMPMGVDVGQQVDKLNGGPGAPYMKKAAGMGDQARAEFLANASNDWYGWSNVLSPAWKPILIFRKKPDGSIPNNVVKHGVGAMNIDGSRMGDEEREGSLSWRDEGGTRAGGHGEARSRIVTGSTTLGRWPTNVAVDADVAEEIGEKSRYFLCAGASKAEKNDGLPSGTNDHPKPRPVALMQWVLGLICPPGETVLDPFCGSGTTGVAAVGEGLGFVGIDLNEHWVNDIAAHRITAARERQEAKRAKRPR